MPGSSAPAEADETCPEWHVSSSRLSLVLPTRVKVLAQAGGADQSVDITGKPLDVVVQQFADAPEVDIEVSLSPADLDPPPVAQLRFEGTQAVEVAPGWPLKVRASAGIYELTADVAGPTPRQGRKLFVAQPPLCQDEVQVP
jgi:hypothetical protein